jgi:hypothetical protein
MAYDDRAGLPTEVRREIKKQAIEQSAKFTVGLFGSLLLLAVAGWGLYIKYKLPDWLHLVPKGAVTAFDISEDCPAGWTRFEDAAGRFILGAGQGKFLLDRPLRSMGGFEWHTLTVDELPRLTIALPLAGVSSVDRYDAGGRNYPVVTVTNGTVTTGGSAKGFETMPPFLALRYCKKV